MTAEGGAYERGTAGVPGGAGGAEDENRGGQGSEPPQASGGDPGAAGTSSAGSNGGHGPGGSTPGGSGGAPGSGGTRSEAGGSNAVAGNPTAGHGGASGNGGVAGSAGTLSVGGGGGGGVANATLPCDVQAVLRARCQACHTKPTAGGAPMPLLLWSDVKKYAGEIDDKVKSGDMPPSSSPALSASQFETLVAYLAADTPPAGDVTCP